VAVEVAAAAPASVLELAEVEEEVVVVAAEETVEVSALQPANIPTNHR
jgi:hypothetical protein